MQPDQINPLAQFDPGLILSPKDVVGGFVTRLLRRPGRPSETVSLEEIVAAYEQAVELVWKSLSPLVGNLGTKAIVGRSVDVAGRKWAFLRRIRVTEVGLDRERLRVALQDVPCAQAVDGLEGLLLRVVEVVRGLTGSILSEQVLLSLSAHRRE